jgi:hypothetical protein
MAMIMTAPKEPARPSARHASANIAVVILSLIVAGTWKAHVIGNTWTGSGDVSNVGRLIGGTVVGAIFVSIPLFAILALIMRVWGKR